MIVLDAFVATWGRILTNRTLVSTMLLAVALYTFYYPAPYAHGVAQRLPVIAVDEDDSALTRRVLRDLQATRAVDIVATEASRSAGAARLRRGDADGMILLSSGLDRTLRTGAEGGGVAVWLNGTYLLRASTVGGAVQQVLSAQPTLIEDGMRPSLTRRGPPVSVTTEPLFNRSASYKGYVFPAVAVIIAQQTLLFGTATMFAGLPRRKGRTRLPATFAGAWLALASLGCLATLFLFGMAFWLQDVPRSAASALLIVSVLPFSAAVAALGMLAGTFMDRPERAVALLAPTSVPIFFLSGVAWPLDQMPAAVQLLSHLLPSTVGVRLFVATNQMNAGLQDVYLQLVQMTSLCVLFGSLAYLGVFKRRLALA